MKVTGLKDLLLEKLYNFKKMSTTQQQIKVYDNVIIKPTGTLFSQMSSEMNLFRTKKIYGIVLSAICPVGMAGYNSTNWSISVQFLKDSNYQKTYNVKQADLEIVSTKDLEKLKKITEEYLKDFGKKDEGLISALKTPAKGDYSKIDVNANLFEKFNKILLTNRVFACKTQIDWKTGKHNSDWTSVEGKQDCGWYACCCDYLKTTKDVIFYIPEYYLNLYGYTVYDLHKWLQFLENCQIDFNYILEGECTFPEQYKYRLSDTERHSKEPYSLYLHTNEIRPNLNTKFIEIKMKNPGAAWHNHLHVICLRYIHSQWHWFIPALAMQIKDALGKKVSNWEALMMAHFHKDMLQTNDRSLTYRNKFHNCFVSPKTIVTNIISNSSMQRSFVYIESRNKDLPKCQEFIEKKDFEGLYNFIKK